MTVFEQTLSIIDSLCKKHQLQYSLIGGYAMILYGVQRMTQDIDITVLVELEDIEKVGNIFLDNGFSPRKEHPIQFFQRYFVLPSTYLATDVMVDIAAGVSNFDKTVVQRSCVTKYSNLEIPVASVEDMIIYKVLANRKIDQYDVEFLFKFHSESIDKIYLLKTAKDFCEIERDDIFETITTFARTYLR